MDTTLVNIAHPVQLIALGVVLLMVIVLGARVVGLGARGFASLIGEIAGLLVGLYVVAQPNAVATLLLTAIGGVVTPTAIH